MKLHELRHMVRMDDYGKMMGFPSCCRSDFLNHFDKRTLPDRNLSGSGYIPCRECNHKYDAFELIERIEAGRKYPIPFINNLMAVEIDGIDWVNRNDPCFYSTRVDIR